MTRKRGRSRKVADADLIKLNSVGLSLKTISEVFDCHQSTITNRLQKLNIQPSDTRRSFMEDIFITLSTSQQEWLADQLNENYSIKDYVKDLLVKAYNNRNPK